MSKIYNVIAGSFVRNTKIVQDTYSDKHEAIIDLMYRVKQYNEIINEINQNTKKDYRQRIIKCDAKNNKILRYESDVDFIAIVVE